MAFPHERQEAFFAGHRQMFERWGGVLRLAVYDNLTTAVRRVLARGRREEPIAFVRLRTHYCYEAGLCNSIASHKKRAVENLVGNVPAALPGPDTGGVRLHWWGNGR